MITYTPAAKYHCRNCGDLFVEPDFELRRGQKLSDNGCFYRFDTCPSCQSENIESVFDYRLRKAQEQGAKQ